MQLTKLSWNKPMFLLTDLSCLYLLLVCPREQVYLIYYNLRLNVSGYFLDQTNLYLKWRALYNDIEK